MVDPARQEAERRLEEGLAQYYSGCAQGGTGGRLRDPGASFRTTPVPQGPIVRMETEVKKLQRDLGIAEGGTMNGATRRVIQEKIEEFQRSTGRAVTGKYDSDTAKAMKENGDPKTKSFAEDLDKVKRFYKPEPHADSNACVAPPVKTPDSRIPDVVDPTALTQSAIVNRPGGTAADGAIINQPGGREIYTPPGGRAGGQAGGLEVFTPPGGQSGGQTGGQEYYSTDRRDNPFKGITSFTTDGAIFNIAPLSGSFISAKNNTGPQSLEVVKRDGPAMFASTDGPSIKTTTVGPKL